MPSLLDDVTAQIATAMKTRDTASLAPLRMLKTALTNREVEKSGTLSDDEARQVVNTLVKQRRDAAEQFEKGGRQELADRERAELTFLQRFLPPEADESTIRDAIDAAVTDTGATSVKEMGAVMKSTMSRLAGMTVDGRRVSALVRERLSQG